MVGRDIQIVLDEWSAAGYAVDYISKANRGISNLHRALMTMRDTHPDATDDELIRKIAREMLNSVEICEQGAAWYLLRLDQSKCSRSVKYINTSWPHERHRIRKTRAQLDKEKVSACSTNVWKSNNIEKYESRSTDLSDVCLADFTSKYYKARDGQHKLAKTHSVI